MVSMEKEAYFRLRIGLKFRKKIAKGVIFGCQESGNKMPPFRSKSGRVRAVGGKKRGL